jgi:glycosyltransferase involved in cell wall biosynthesis
VSVVIPSYNCGRFLPETLDSVLSQTFKDYEIIVIDDGSTDNTEQIVKPYTNSITYLRGPNKGASAARNSGMKIARGELVAFLDADDLWDSEKLGAQVTFMDSHPKIGVNYTNCTFFDGLPPAATGFEERDSALLRYSREKIANSDYILTGTSLLEDFLTIQAFPKPSTLMVRRQCFEQVGYFDETLYICEDTQMCLRLAKYFRFGYVDRPLVRRRVRTDTLSSAADNRRYAAIHIQMFDDLSKWIALSDNEKAITTRLVSSYCFSAGYAEFSDGRSASGRHHFQKSFKTCANLRALAYLLMTFLPLNWIKTFRIVKQQLAR